jgi:serine/threonine protein kinase
MNASTCPDKDRLRQLLAGAVPAEEQLDLDRHLQGCPGCRETLASLSGHTRDWSPSEAPTIPPADFFASSPIAEAEAAEATLVSLGNYRIIETLEDGRLKAFEPRLQRFVSIRLLPPEQGGDLEARRRFAQAARAAAAVDHENLVTVHAVDESGPQPFVVTEHVVGVSLAQRLAQPDKPSFKEVLRIGQQVAAGLAALHARGLTHGHLSPASVLLEEGSGRVKLIDAGPTGDESFEVTQRADLAALGEVLLALCAAGKAPAWLRERINALRDAPSPPSAADTSDLLRRQLAALQPRPATVRPPSRRRRRRLAVLLLLLALLAGAGWLGYTETTGQTTLLPAAATLITGQATLALDLQDPEARVAIAGFEDEYADPGSHDILLRPGDYLVRISRPGRPVEEQEVALGWAARRPLQVTFEPPQPREKPFVVRSRRDFPEQHLSTLADAVRTARPGDVIEIHGDGPFPSPPINIPANKPLTIRAAPGFRPVIAFNDVTEDRGIWHLHSYGALTLEGLELHITGQRESGKQGRGIVGMNGAAFHAAWCRFLVKNHGIGLQLYDTSKCLLRNCEFIRNSGSWHGTLQVLKLRPKGGLAITDSVIAGGHYGLMLTPETSVGNVAVTLRGNTLVVSTPLFLTSRIGEPATEEVKGAPVAAEIEIRDNVIDSPSEFFRFNQSPGKDDKPLTGAEVETGLLRLVRWRMRDNLLPEGVPLTRVATGMHQIIPGTRPRPTLAEWDRYWLLPANHSIQDHPVYDRQDLKDQLGKAPGSLKAADFKLAPDSPGVRCAGKRDLGADVANLGPGAGYDQWRKTTAYRDWQKMTGQIP